MNPLLLARATRVLAPVMLVFSLVLLARGHDDPGGGFVGGLVAAAALVLVALAEGGAALRRVLRVDPLALVAVGLALALLAALVGLAGDGLLDAAWWSQPVPGFGKLGTPVLFDLGVMLAVVGVTLACVLSFLEDG
ncbi:MAG: Na(+)/H(+) antiporter subunit B [Planctomycetes bacterium]|nr:Na(+)/H(+) antiporter subunit B [Planctomycetota bacterium]